MRLLNAEERTGTTGAVAPIPRQGSDGTLDREPILPHGGMLLFEMALVLPPPGPEGHDGR